MKKIVSLLLGALLAASAAVTVSAANVSDFSDMPDDWSTAALTAAVENGLLTGSDGMILPKDNLTRAQMATIIVRAFNASKTSSLSGFTDVPADAWYYEYMSKAVAMGVFAGDGSGLLTPESNITREQVFIVLARTLALPAGDASVLDRFSDKDEVSSWAVDYAAALVGGGYVNGSDGYLNPKGNITRAEFAQIMYNMFKTYIDVPQTLTGEYEGNVVIRCSNVTIGATAHIVGNLIICENCDNVSWVDRYRITGSIIDHRDVKPADKKDDVIYWQIVDGGSSNSSSPFDGSHVGQGDPNEEGWSDTYRP